jgi:hypothetical protein
LPGHRFKLGTFRIKSCYIIMFGVDVSEELVASIVGVEELSQSEQASSYQTTRCNVLENITVQGAIICTASVV